MTIVATIQMRNRVAYSSHRMRAPFGQLRLIGSNIKLSSNSNPVSEIGVAVFGKPLTNLMLHHTLPIAYMPNALREAQCTADLYL